jgi:osmoprotectant transport system substrate-binding protein
MSDMRVRGCLLLALLACLLASGCGGASKESGEVTIVVGSRGYGEDEVLREIYAQSLRAAGFKVRESNFPAGLLLHGLEEGRLSGYVDHLDTAFAEATEAEPWDAPGSADLAYREIRARSEGKGLVPFAPASYRRSSTVAIPREIAEAEGLAELSDLRGPARKMSVLEREVYCFGRERCLGAMERGYGVVFAAFQGLSLSEPSSAPYAALRSGETDAAVVVDTEGRLAHRGRWLTLLEDDKHRLQATNPLWMTTQDVIDEAGPAYERALLAAQKGLTVRSMRRLNAEVELEGKSPAAVASEYLKSLG